MDVEIIELCELDVVHNLEALATLLIATVEGGGAIGFLTPLEADDARRFWLDAVRPEVAIKARTLFAARRNGSLAGSVQLITTLPPNQPHRCEIAKMMVHPGSRRLGIGRMLLTSALERASALERTIVTLDTRTGDAAEQLYASAGFEAAGVIPDYALDPDRSRLHATTLMYRRIENRTLT